ncbi:DoxX family protein [Mycobacterium koreense]|uniref:Uncharacterized protein n=1 Tax=Mycolicibacillus koreensis TaxID=1069220 RepID=A0A7I7SHK8_9MYCO|nr:DoxX family protein [Mycolicibacillus koreensis]MCV7248516.1 DoxX family protein [Mycolicibacillus koreensis]ODR11910.1 hypothetical protein BHQ15_00860 [Mycolicibacillus koreensis]OSC32731.1 hypothetical protein B8W67_14410 [Mycolicibacillus koreensis]BBY55475.1 hypothetical protein MKOR_27260 [Mycolicibacillus koreensis]
MAPLITLLLGSAGARALGALGVNYLDSWPRAIAIGLAAMFVLTGVAHFAPPLRRQLIAIVPPALPAPALLVSITGVLELLGAAGLLVPATRVVAAACLLVLMVVMFPANVYAARMPNPPAAMSTRLPQRSAEELLYLGAAVIVIVATV